MSRPNMLTAFSDLVLALVTSACIHFLFETRNTALPAYIGYGIITAAALFGVFFFAGVRVVKPVHQLLSALGRTVGMPLIGLHLLVAALRAHPEHKLLNEYASRLDVEANSVGIAVALTVLAIVTGAKKRTNKVYTEIMGAIGILPWIVVIWIERNPENGSILVLMIAALALLIASVIIVEQKKVFGLSGVDWFHYMFAFSLYFVHLVMTVYFEIHDTAATTNSRRHN